MRKHDEDEDLNEDTTRMFLRIWIDRDLMKMVDHLAIDQEIYRRDAVELLFKKGLIALAQEQLLKTQ